MKRNYLALLLAIIMIAGCIFASVPAAFAAENDTTGDTTTDDTTADAPAEDAPVEDTPADESAEEEQPNLIVQILIYIIKFFKWLLALLGL